MSVGCICRVCGKQDWAESKSFGGPYFLVEAVCFECGGDPRRKPKVQEASGERASSDDRGSEALGEGSSSGEPADVVSQSPESREAAERVIGSGPAGYVVFPELVNSLGDEEQEERVFVSWTPNNGHRISVLNADLEAWASFDFDKPSDAAIIGEQLLRISRLDHDGPVASPSPAPPSAERVTGRWRCVGERNGWIWDVMRDGEEIARFCCSQDFAHRIARLLNADERADDRLARWRAEDGRR